MFCRRPGSHINVLGIAVQYFAWRISFLCSGRRPAVLRRSSRGEVQRSVNSLRNLDIDKICHKHRRANQASELINRHQSMATSSIDYLTGTGISPSSSPSPAIAASTSPAVSPSPAASAPAASTGGLWNGHLKPAEIQITIIGTHKQAVLRSPALVSCACAGIISKHIMLPL